jgi:hypothetical protein
METLTRLLNSFPVKLLLAVTLISQVVGQFYPFSRFPMYSSFPPETDVFFIADPQGNPLPSLETVGIFTQEIKQRVEHQMEDLGDPYGPKREQLLREAGKLVLGHIFVERRDMLRAAGVDTLTLRRQVLHRESGQLVIQETEVAAWH